MKKVIVKGPALSQSGYGEQTRFILRSLRSQPAHFDIYLINITWGSTGWLSDDSEERQWIDFLLAKTIQYSSQGGQMDISIQVTIPQEWERLAPYNIGATAGTETTKISPLWLEKSMMMDKIIVISEHTKYAFANTTYPAEMNGQQITAKIECPIEVVGYPVKKTTPQKIDLDLKYDFNFLAVGTWIVRKNLPNTIKWFVEEFYDQKVGLIVKTSTAKNSLRDRNHTEMTLKNILEQYEGRECEVYLLHGDLTEEEMAGLYTHDKVKALVSLAHGEGYGLPIFEAVYNGLPVVSPGWGGPLDFLCMPVKQKNGSFKKIRAFTDIAYDVKPIQAEAVWDNVLIKESMWCYPKEWNYKKSLRLLKKSPGASKAQAKKLQKWVLDEFEESKLYQKVCDSVYKPSKEEEEWNSMLNEVQMI